MMKATLINEISNNRIEKVKEIEGANYTDLRFKVAYYFLSSNYEYLDVIVEGGVDFQMQRRTAGVRLAYFNGTGAVSCLNKTRVNRYIETH